MDALLEVGNDIRTLKESVEGLTEAIQLMATKDEVAESEARQDRKRRLVWIGVAVVVAYIVVSTLALGVLLYRLNGIADTNQENGNILVECTTASQPGDDHECYDQAQVNQAKAVEVLTLGMLDAAICARTEATVEAIETCFENRLAARQPANGG